MRKIIVFFFLLFALNAKAATEVDTLRMAMDNGFNHKLLSVEMQKMASSSFAATLLLEKYQNFFTEADKLNMEVFFKIYHLNENTKYVGLLRFDQNNLIVDKKFPYYFEILLTDEGQVLNNFINKLTFDQLIKE